MTRLSHLDAVQGNSEERTSRISDTESERLSIIDTAMRQERQQSSKLCLEAGWRGAEVQCLR